LGRAVFFGEDERREGRRQEDRRRKDNAEALGTQRFAEKRKRDSSLRGLRSE
jgi:hypothetical protein